jgi:hypothetical protein
MHGRGLGDDRPLLLTSTEAKPDYEATERSMNLALPENGVYICKPTVFTADRKVQFPWGDTIRITPRGAKRMGSAPHGIVISEAQPFTGWPTDYTAFD